MLSLKQEFPFFHKHPEITYLDSASTTLKPQVVIETINDYLTSSVNIKRGDYKLSRHWNNKVEESIQSILSFIDAPEDSMIVFTTGATDAINKLCLLLQLVIPRNEIVIYAPDDHESLTSAIGELNPKYKLLSVTKNNLGIIDESSLRKNMADAKAAFITHVHSVYGIDENLTRIRAVLDTNAYLFVDCSQSIGHAPFSMKEIKADAIFFSGHKIFADTGIGVLILSNRFVQNIKPLVSQWQKGTPNISGIVSLGAAVNYLNGIGMKKVHSHLAQMTQYAKNELSKITGIYFTKGIGVCPKKDGYGIISFFIANQSCEDIAFALDRKNILIRGGRQCSGEKGKNDNVIRVSMHVYNTTHDVDVLISELKGIL